jgi:hypothetical protein
VPYVVNIPAVRDDYIAVESGGILFRFYLDRELPSVLHIYARHGMQIADSEAHWDEQHRRFENRSGTRSLYWAWKRPNEEVIVITCFEKE